MPQCKGIEVIRNDVNLGFLKSCNKAAAQAKGQYLVFLDNDTLVTDRWLSELIATFAMRPDAGLVGAKLVFPYGFVQEAGGIVWDEGKAWNYGKFSDPYRPEVNYLREVDYCSGAAIAIPQSLFHEVGGFDDLYAPSHYEDADLAFKVRAAGRKVYYQPFSKVWHFEGVSSGVSLNRGVERHQVTNQVKFAKRWAAALRERGPQGNPELDKDRGVRGRILVIDRQFLWPDRDSGSVRAFAMLKLLVELGYKVTFFWQFLLHQGRYTEALQRLGVEVYYWPFVTHPRRHLRDFGKQYDVIVLCRAVLADWLIDAVRRYAPQAKIVFDTVDLMYLREQREAELPGATLTRERALERKQQELGVVRKADYTLVVSPFEAKVLEKEAPTSDVRVVSNIHRIFGQGKPFAERRGILFIGSFLHRPNVDAVLFLVREILPLLADKLPEVQLFLVGTAPSAEVLQLASDRVVVVGHVPDVAPYFQSCRLSVAPLRYGAGVKGKINMSMSYGLPVVGTSIAVEGMHLEHEVNTLIADTPADFAAAVARLYLDQELWERLAENGLRNVEQYFGEEVARKALSSLMEDAMGRPEKRIAER